MAEPIEIIIRQGGQNGAGLTGSFGGGVGVGSQNVSSRMGAFNQLMGNTSPGDGLFKNFDVVSKEIVDYLKGNVKQAISYSISQYGDMTGNYIGQRQIQNVMSVTGDMIGVVMAGVKLGAPGLAVAIAAKTVSASMQLRSFIIDVKKQNIQAEFMRERAGSTLGSGSRGTYV